MISTHLPVIAAEPPFVDNHAETTMPTQLKRKIAFAMLMGIVTTGIISFVLIALNVGFSAGFALVWLKSWSIAYLIVIPAILLIGPRLQAKIDGLIQ
jgi:uncharacterized membrane protein SpoIIM required for sporulation